MAALVNDLDKLLESEESLIVDAVGVANYTWRKYADSAAGDGMSDSPTGKAYLGLAFNKTTATPSTVPTDYAWSLIKGLDGKSTFVASVYLQQAAQPSSPSGGSYNFSNNVLTPPTGWSATQPSITTTPTWMVQFSFTSSSVGATVTAGTWSVAVNVGQSGAGGSGSTPTAGELKDILTGQLTEDQLYTTLKSRIALIDDSASTPGSVAAQVKAETDARVAAIAQEVTDRTTYVQQWGYSKAASDQSQSAFGASIQAAYQGYADNAAASALTAAKAYSQSYSYSKADSDSAISASANELRSEFQTLNSGADATVAWVQQYAYSKAQTDSAIASSTQQLSSTVGGLTTTVQTQGESINGLSGQYSVKIDNNGYVSGYGLASTPINGVPTSSFIVSADRFAVALPGQAAKFPFVIGTVAGHQVIGLRGDLVLDGTFSARDASGKVIFDVGSSLANQTSINPNLVERLSQWTRVGGAALFASTASGFAINGESLLLDNTGTPIVFSRSLSLLTNTDYTLTFKAHAANNAVLSFDLGNAAVPTTQLTLSTTHTPYEFHWNSSSSLMSAVNLRFFATSPAGQIVLSDVKLEQSLKPTAWCDNVMTRANMSTFMAAAAIDLAFINTASIGQLSALAAFLGAVDIGPNGHIASGQTDYNVGNGLFIGGSNAPRMSMRTANGNTFLCDPANNVLSMSGVALSNFSMPKMTLTIDTTQIIVTRPNTSTAVSLGYATASVSNATGAVSYQWAVTQYLSDPDGQTAVLTLTNDTTPTVSLSGRVLANTGLIYTIQCVATDSNGLTAVASFYRRVQFGTAS